MSTSRRAQSPLPQAYEGAAGKNSSSLNTPRGGRSIKGNHIIVSEVSSVLKGTAPLVQDNSFVHFHIKRRILPNTKDSVIVPINVPSPVRVRKTGISVGDAVENSNNSTARGGGGSAPTTGGQRTLTQRGDINKAAVDEKPFTIGKETFDVPDKRHKKSVELPKHRIIKPRPLLEKKSEAASVLPGPNFGAGQGRANENVALDPSIRGKAGKHIPKQEPYKLETTDSNNNSVTRYTRAPFWDSHAKPPAGYEYGLPTKNFAVPRNYDQVVALRSKSEPRQQRSAVAAGISSSRASSVTPAPSSRGGSVPRNKSSSSSSSVAPSANSSSVPRQQPPHHQQNNKRASSVPSHINRLDMFSPNRLIARKKNESVVDECLGGRIGAATKPLKTTIVDHDGHNAKGWLDVNGKKRCQTPNPAKWQVYAPTLSNSQTNVFRYRPDVDHRGKNTGGNERKSRNNDALGYGDNFASCARDVRDLREHPVGKASCRSVSADPKRSSSSNNNNNNFQRSSTNSSLIEAPFDRTTNTGKYEPTFESRTTCRAWHPYVRPLLKKQSHQQ